MKARHLARRVALQALFEIDIAQHKPDAVLRSRLADQEAPLTAEAEEFARHLVYGVTSI